MESLNEEDQSLVRVRYSSKKRLRFYYTENDIVLVWSAKRRTGLDVWQEWMDAMINLDRKRSIEVWNSNCERGFLIINEYCGKQCGHNYFAVFAHDRNFSYFVVVNGREDSSLWECSGRRGLL